MKNDKERVDLLLFLLNKRALDKKSSIPLVDCPIKGVNLKELTRYKKIKMHGKTVSLTRMGKIIAAGELSMRLRDG
jgi:hypothetical protein